jgi:thiol-disulfide isomerase/thioredoxin
MKKNLFSFLITALFISGMNNADAQLADGCIAPDFNVTDINGNTWHLYTILDQGKTVFIDISATWCHPCWLYHTSGALENLYNQYGPPGTNELMVFMVEGDANTNTACLYGPTGCNNSTQGDWVTGTPYPIIDDASIATAYQINYFPTIYMITPDRICRENDQITTAQHYSAMQQYAFPAIAGNDAGINWGCTMNASVSGCAGVSMDVRLFNYSTSPLTSATIEVSVNSVVQQTIPWTGNLATYGYATIHITGITGSTGSNTAQITVTSANGSPDNRSANNTASVPFTIYANTGGPAVMESFPTAVFPPSGWTVTNGGIQNTWAFSSAGYNGAGSAKMEFFNSFPSDLDVLSLPPIDFTSYNSASLTFDKSHKMSNAGFADNLTIKVSVNCGASWTDILNQTDPTLANVSGYTGNVPWTPSSPSDWAPVTIPLTSYLGNSAVLIKFEANSGYGNNLYLDNINVNLVTGTETISSNNVDKLFPNPAADKATLTLRLSKAGDVTINVLNTIGQMVETIVKNNLSPSEYSFSIGTVKLSPGIYSVNVISPDGISSNKLIVK